MASWRKFKELFLLVVALTSTPFALTQKSLPREQQDSTENELAVDDFQRLSVVPVLGYTEETEFQYGVMVLFFLRPEHPNGKVPEIGVTAYGSTRGQLQLSFEPYFYFLNDQIRLWSLLKYQDWVASYFGRGNSPNINRFVNYDRQKFQLESKLEFSIGLPRIYKYGAALHVEHTDISFRESGDIRQPPDGSGWRNGVGYILGVDTRDNTNWTKSGFLVQWQQMFYSGVLGDFSFDSESFDARTYTKISDETTVAAGMLWQRVQGDVPFDMLAGPDGIQRFRGVESLYFGDNQALILQAELRQSFFWRFAGHLFVEGGKSGKYFSDLMRNDWHKAVGIGALLGLNLKENLFARADFSWVDLDHLGMSFYVRQAF